MRKQQGFTLIELMIAVMIIGVLAAIAFPSYQRYTVKNAEANAKAQIGQIELQLANWRASALSYRGFVPINGADANGPTYGYAANTTTANTVIYLPLGRTINNYDYVLEIVDGESRSTDVNGRRTGSTSLVPVTASADAAEAGDLNSALGRSYMVVAYPNRRLQQRGAKKFFVHSNGSRCFAAPAFQANLNLTSRDCAGVGVETWQ
ncbi:MAG: pilin [Moraxella sp.]|nr:pilin [Moraxella sp.]